MKKLSLLSICLLLFVACQESLEKRAQRTLQEYSEKNCPQRISETIVLDSCSFDINTTTLHYYYTLMGAMDNDSIVNQNGANMRNLILDALKNETSARVFKEAGYNYEYTYFSNKNAGKILFKTTLTKDDYQ